MSLPTLEPTWDEDVVRSCRFLTAYLSRERTPGEWAGAFRQDWHADKPNNGFLIPDPAASLAGSVPSARSGAFIEELSDSATLPAGA
jgi:hypothetical protein